MRLAEEIYIFDIDGCIMPPIISNFNGDNDKSREKTINEIINNGSKLKLYPEFVNYYRKNCRKAESVVFITGRKKREFGELTKNQLKPLKSVREFQIIYYPEGNHHKSDEYFEWKSKKIQKIIDGYLNGDKSVTYFKKTVLFNIFDDMNEYFTEIQDYGDKLSLEIYLFLIDGKDSWNSLIQ